jgi:hypothetical protein
LPVLEKLELWNILGRLETCGYFVGFGFGLPSELQIHVTFVVGLLLILMGRRGGRERERERSSLEFAVVQFVAAASRGLVSKRFLMNSWTNGFSFLGLRRRSPRNF